MIKWSACHKTCLSFMLKQRFNRCIKLSENNKKVLGIRASLMFLEHHIEDMLFSFFAFISKFVVNTILNRERIIESRSFFFHELIVVYMVIFFSNCKLKDSVCAGSVH